MQSLSLYSYILSNNQHSCKKNGASSTAGFTNMKATKIVILECDHVGGVHNYDYKSDMQAVINAII